MPSRRELISMSDDERRAFLDEPRTLNVGTIGPTGHPHLVAMWFIMRGDEPVFWTFTKSQKALNLQRDPRISGLVEAGTTYAELRGVEVRGTARLITDPEEVFAIGRDVMNRYNPQPLDEAAEAGFRAQATKRVGVAIEPEHWATWDHRKLGGVY